MLLSINKFGWVDYVRVLVFSAACSNCLIGYCSTFWFFPLSLMENLTHFLLQTLNIQNGDVKKNLTFVPLAPACVVSYLNSHFPSIVYL